MPYFNIHNFLTRLHATKGQDVFVLQIGAMDGKTFDPIHPYLDKYKWAGLMVEPVEEHYTALQSTYQDYASIQTVRAAITDQNGTVTMYNIPMEHVHRKDVPKWAGGLSSLYKNRNAMDFEKIKPYITETQVPCMTVKSLLTKNNINQIDLLQIDAEGHDYHVLKQFDLSDIRPAIINIEYVNLPKNEQADCKKLLDEKRYFFAKGGYDLLAVSYEFLEEIVKQTV